MDGSIISVAEQLKTELERLKKDIRKGYGSPHSQVTSVQLRNKISSIAEKCLVDFSVKSDVLSADRSKALKENFEKLLLCTEKATKRFKYDDAIANILNGFTAEVIIPLKSNFVSKKDETINLKLTKSRPTLFLAHSFKDSHKDFVNLIIRYLTSLGLEVITGEKPKAAGVSEKVKRLIQDQDFFLALFLRDKKIARRDLWTTSVWTIGEMVYANTIGKPSILLVENKIEAIGGIQGDYEYIPFDRSEGNIFVPLAQMFKLQNNGLVEF
jgi:hypothetical protein